MRALSHVMACRLVMPLMLMSAMFMMVHMLCLVLVMPMVPLVSMVSVVPSTMHCTMAAMARIRMTRVTRVTRVADEVVKADGSLGRCELKHPPRKLWWRRIWVHPAIMVKKAMGCHGMGRSDDLFWCGSL